MIARLKSPESKLILQDLEYGAATCKDIAEALGMCRSAAWRHLQALVNAGKVKKCSFERTRGKPADIYVKVGRYYNCRKFTPLTPAERSARYYQRKKDEKLRHV